MAHGGDDGAPYWRAQSIVIWAHQNRSYINGRMVMAGLEDLDGAEWVDLVWALALDFYAGMSSRGEVEEAWRKALEWGSPLNPDRETWGETEDAKAGARAMAALVGQLPKAGTEGVSPSRAGA